MLYFNILRFLIRYIIISTEKIVKQIEKKALNFCFEKKFRLTDPRKFVLKILASSNKPLKAYEVLDHLGKLIKNPKPPTAYRAIEFWHKHNFIHRIESLNAYTACEAQHLHNGSQFMICDSCGKVIESHICDLPSVILESIKKKTFKPTKWNLEINGVCNQCT